MAKRNDLCRVYWRLGPPAKTNYSKHRSAHPHMRYWAFGIATARHVPHIYLHGAQRETGFLRNNSCWKSREKTHYRARREFSPGYRAPGQALANTRPVCAWWPRGGSRVAWRGLVSTRRLCGGIFQLTTERPNCYSGGVIELHLVQLQTRILNVIDDAIHHSRA